MAINNQKPVIFLAFANERNNQTRYLRELEKEYRSLKEILEQAVEKGLCELEIHAAATVDSILHTFQKYRNQIAIFHFGGHANGYQLLVESSEGQTVTADAGGLAAFLRQQTGLQLVFLNGCSTQQHVQGLLGANVSAVIVTSQAIDDRVATEFAFHFYQSIASGAKIRTAYEEAQAAVETARGGKHTRGALYRVDQINEDRWPWELHVRPGANVVLDWNLPEAANDPLFGLPSIPEKYLQNLPDSPFRGLQWFTREHAALFFGRGYQIRELYQHITEPYNMEPIVLFYGQSGVGKSSLLAAGLRPRLEHDHTLRYQRRNQGQGLSGSLKAALLMDKEGTTSLLKTWLATEERLNRPLVVILDQIEETFTRPNESQPSELRDFLDVLQEIFMNPDQRPRGKLIMGFRKEWLAEIKKNMLDYRLPHSEVFLQCLDKRGIIRAITGVTQATRLQAKYKLKVAEDLPGLIADDLLADKESPVAPILQILLTKMWEQARQKDYNHPTFDHELYDALRREGLGLQNFLDLQLETLHTFHPDEVDSGLVLDILAFHTTPLSTAEERNREKLQETYAHQEKVLQPLIQRCEDLYLLVDPSKNDPEKPSTSRLAHDTLAPLVRQRFDESDKPGQRARRILENRAVEWQHEQIGTPLDQQDLALVEQGVSGMRAWNEHETRLVEASREEQRKRKRRRHIWQGTGIIAIVLIFLLAGVASWQWLDAEDARLVAEHNADEARSLLWTSRAQQATDSTLAIALALTANRIASPPSLAQQALAEVTYPPGIKRVFATGHTGKVWSMAYNAGTAVSGSEDGSLILWDVTTGEPMRRFEGHTDSVWSVTLSADGQTVLSGSADRTLILWNIRTGQIMQRFEGHRDTVWSVALSTDGRTALSGSSDQTLILWDTTTGELIRRLEGHQNTVLSVALSADGRTALSGSSDRTLILWDTTTGEPIRRFEGHDDFVLSVALSTDGKTALSGSADRTLILWDTETGRVLQRFKGHTGSVWSVALSADGRTALSGSSDRTLILWDTATGKLLQRLEGHKGSVNSVVLNSDNTTAISAGDDRTLMVWNTTTGELLQRFAGHTDIVQSVALSADGQVALSGSADHDLILWDTITSKLIRRFEGHHDAVVDVALNADGRFALSGSADHTLILWDTKTGTLMQRFATHQTAVSSVALSADGHLAISGSTDNSLILWDTKTGKLLRHLEGHQGAIRSVALNAEGDTALSGSDDSSLILWDTSTGKVIRRLEDHDGPIRGVALSADGRIALSAADKFLISWNTETGRVIQRFDISSLSRQQIVSIRDSESGTPIRWFDSEIRISLSADGQTALFNLSDTLILWDTFTGEILQEFQGHSNIILDVALSRDGRTAFSCGYDQKLILWNTMRGDVLKRFKGHTASVQSIALNGDGRRILSGSADGSLILWDTETGQHIWQDRYDGVNSVALSADGNLAIMASTGLQTILWDMETGTKRFLSGHSESVTSVALSADGQTALSGSVDQTVILWNTKIGEFIRILEGHTGTVRCVALSADGHFALSGSDDRSIILWDLATGKLLQRFEGHNGGVIGGAFSPDEKFVLSGAKDKTLIRWDIETGQPQRTFSSPDEVTSVAFSPDGETILSGARDGSMTLWETETGQPIRRFEGHDGPVLSLVYSPDGKTALSGSSDGTLILWRIHTHDELIAWTYANHPVRELTCEERETYLVEPLCDEFGNLPISAPTPTIFPIVQSPTVGPADVTPAPTPTPLPTPTTPSLKIGEAFSWIIQNDRQQTWYFQGQQGQDITVSVRAKGIDLDPSLELYDPKNALLGKNNECQEQNVSISQITLPETGRYTIIVQGCDHSAGRYTIQLH